jgi:hypothetical protein
MVIERKGQGYLGDAIGNGRFPAADGPNVCTLKQGRHGFEQLIRVAVNAGLSLFPEYTAIKK